MASAVLLHGQRWGNMLLAMNGSAGMVGCCHPEEFPQTMLRGIRAVSHERDRVECRGLCTPLPCRRPLLGPGLCTVRVYRRMLGACD